MNFMAPRNRQQHLAATRNLKMAGSPHAFVRGSTIQFYEWLGRVEHEPFQGG